MIRLMAAALLSAAFGMSGAAAQSPPDGTEDEPSRIVAAANPAPSTGDLPQPAPSDIPTPEAANDVKASADDVTGKESPTELEAETAEVIDEASDVAADEAIPTPTTTPGDEPISVQELQANYNARFADYDARFLDYDLRLESLQRRISELEASGEAAETADPAATEQAEAPAEDPQVPSSQ